MQSNDATSINLSNRRVLGSLLSAHLLIEDEDQDFGYLKPPGYAGELLTLAQQLADKFLPAFENSLSGLPHPRVLTLTLIKFLNNDCIQFV